MTRPSFAAMFAASTLALLAAGCGSSDNNTAADATDGPAVTSPAVTAAAGETTATADVGGSDCPADVVAAVTQAVTDAAVTKIELIGGCSLVNISTSLADDGIAAALDICDAAATVAYVGNVNGVSVASTSNKEIALGVKGAPCIGEP